MVCSVMGVVICVPVIAYLSLGIGSLVSTNILFSQILIIKFNTLHCVYKDTK